LLLLLTTDYCLLPHGSASTLTKNLKLPVCWRPSKKRISIEAPLASGVPIVTVPEESEELNPPPFGCEGGCSSLVPCTVTLDVPFVSTKTKSAALLFVSFGVEIEHWPNVVIEPPLPQLSR
jgi:hypothetical protein